MPAPGIGQPQLPGILEVNLTDVVATEAGGLAPSVVLPAGNTFTLTTSFSITGALVGLLVGDTFNVVHHVTNIETGTTTSLGGGSFAVPAPLGGVANIAHVSGPFTTADTGGIADLVIPAGFDSGTFRILTHAHAAAAAIAPIVAAFQDDTIMMVTKP